MNNTSYMNHANYFFHGCRDREITRATSEVSSAIAQHAGKTVIVKEREVSYRFYPYFHPYVQKLMQKLLRYGIKGLQAADTEYAGNNTAIPGSIEIFLSKGTDGISIHARSNIALLDTCIVRANDEFVELAGNMEIELTNDTKVKIADDIEFGLRATLIEALELAIEEGESFRLPAEQEAVVYANAKIVLSQETTIKLYDGTSAAIPAGKTVLLLGGTRITIPGQTHAVLLKKKRQPKLFAEFFVDNYDPQELVQPPYPVKDLDFTSSGAYSVYNWELFFHVPLTIAIHLSKNQRFAEAQQWFHYIFDPTDDSDDPTPERFWKVRPLHFTHARKLEEILVNLSTGADPVLKEDTIHSIGKWRQNPFRPHVIARFRQQSYMYKTVMAYLDNLIAWGDSLFRQDTGEAVDEAMMLYILAANILGPRPQAVPEKGSVRPQTYHELSGNLDKFGNAMCNLELDLPFDTLPNSDDGAGDERGLAVIRRLGQTLCFCVPRNDKLLSYWDTVSDRLFKIRHSLNIQGVFRQLALFEPPIDPALLARAAAAGLDVAAIVNGLNQPLPLVRFQFLVQKAAEIAQEVKSLGGSLLAAMEKEDGEAMAILRAKHERTVMEMVEHVKYGQLQGAIKSWERLQKSFASAQQRYIYYERLLGRESDEIENAIPKFEELDKTSLGKMKFVMNEPEMGLREINVDIAQDLGASGGKIMSSYEANEMAKLAEAHDEEKDAAEKDRWGAGLSYIPEITINMQPIGAGTSIRTGGIEMSRAMSFWSSFGKAAAMKASYKANVSKIIGGYDQREREWAHQSNLAAGEINQIFKQMRAAEIRQAIADMELTNHKKQMKQAEEVERFLNEEGTQKTGKTSNKALYAWMKREVKGLYGQVFQFAFDIAKKAERALQHELGDPKLSYLQFGYLSGKEGLLAGEKLYFDIKRMEMAYHELNQREYELTKHVSLLQVDPLALIQLRATGNCTVALPEALFDMDGPGHYFRRIKNVAVSIPCITGPFTSVNCTLTLLKSSIRITQTLKDDKYAREDAEDDRFSDYFGSLQSIVTSSGKNDSGLFETNLRDERYLPFENSGVISEWQLQLPADPDPSKGVPAQFDYDTISDVILHIRYTAREGGELLRSGAFADIEAMNIPGATRLFSVRHEFPDQWANFKSTPIPQDQLHALVLNLRNEHYPYWSQGKLECIKQIQLFAKSSQNQVPSTFCIYYNESGEESSTLSKPGLYGELLYANIPEDKLPDSPITTLKLFFDNNALADFWVAMTWSP